MTIDNATSVAAGAAIINPWWIPSLATMSGVLSVVLQLLGIVWFGVQITVKVLEYRNRRR